MTAAAEANQDRLQSESDWQETTIHGVKGMFRNRERSYYPGLPQGEIDFSVELPQGAVNVILSRVRTEYMVPPTAFLLGINGRDIFSTQNTPPVVAKDAFTVSFGFEGKYHLLELPAFVRADETGRTVIRSFHAHEPGASLG